MQHPAPPGLYNRVIERINYEHRLLLLKRRLYFYFGVFALCAAAFTPVIQMLYSDAVHSGVMQYFSLVFTDYGEVARYWQNFAMSILETLPITSLIIFLFTILILLESLKHMVKDINSFLNIRKSLNA